MSHDRPVGRVNRLSRLSGRLILLMACFVVIAQAVIFVPAATAYRASWLSDRVMGAQMIALALTVTPREAVTPEFGRRLLAGISGAQAIGLRNPSTRWLLATSGDALPSVRREIDLRNASWWSALEQTLATFVEPPSPATRVISEDAPAIPGAEWVELILDETPLRLAVLAFSRTFLIVSLLTTASAAAVLYLALHLTVVRPVRRLTKNITDFAANPSDSGRILTLSGRADELGRAESALAHMETILATELRQKRHLAELGLAVSKINHELRNMLTTAQLLGDRLTALADPAVKSIAPRLIRTLDRAIAYCEATLSYGRASEPVPNRHLVRLRPIVHEQLDFARTSEPAVKLDLVIPGDLDVDADPEQLGRVLLNLIQNAVGALRAVDGDRSIAIVARRQDGSVLIRIADSGPGIPEPVREQLFSAFQGSRRIGGTGLGLPVAREIVELHGGTLTLEPTSTGATFLVTIPDRFQA